MTSDEIRDKSVFPAGFMRCASQPSRGRHGLSEVPHRRDPQADGRDLTRFDLDFDLPDRFLPEFPSPST